MSKKNFILYYIFQETKTKEDDSKKTISTKVTRRGSVKALSQKFIENAGTY